MVIVSPVGRSVLLVVGLVLALAAAGCSSSSSGGGFLTQSLAVVDLNGNGRLDVLSANAVAPGSQSFLTARIQESTPPGTFQPPVRSPTGLDPVAIAVGDLNGDGLPDVAVADHAAGSGGLYFVDVQFQVAGSPGTFSAPVALALGALRPRDLVLADLDGDGRLDIAVAAGGAASAVQVFFQAAVAGSFGPATGFAVGGEPTAVAAADLTGSGHRDLVVTTATGNVTVLLHGASPGSFLPGVSYPAGESLAAVQVADVNGDGHPDVLAVDYVGALVVLLQAPAGDGTLLAPVTYRTRDFGSCSLAVGDLDGDGRPDVVVANAGPPGDPGSVAVFLQDPATPGLLRPAALYQGYWGPLWVVIGDLDGDGRPDLVIADGTPAIRYQSPTVPGAFLPPVWLKQ
jgi:hypothetical protein